MSQATIRERLRVILEAVTDVGAIHDYERWHADYATFLDLFKVAIGGRDQIRGTMLAYRGMTQELHDTETLIRAHTFLIIVFIGLNDEQATEKTAADLVASIVDDIDKDATLNAPATYTGLEPCQVETFEPRLFGDVLCHYAEIRKVVLEQFDWNP